MIKKVFLFNIIIFFIFVSSLEVIARILHLADLRGVNSNLIIFERDLHVNATNIESSVFSKKVFTDKYGFRVPKKNFNYKNKNSSILILGDSVSFGVGVEEKDTFVGMLRNEFKNFNFFNSSVSGYHLKHYPKIVNKNKNLDQLSEVVYIFTLNDISFKKTIFNLEDEIKKNKVDKNIKFFNKLKTNIYLKKINFFLRSKSVFYMWIKGIVTKPSERHFYYTYPIYQDTIAVKGLSNEIKKLKKITEENNFKLSVIILPYEFQTRLENCNKNFLQPQNIVKDILINLNIKFYDYTKSFCNFEKPSLLFLKYDPVHLSPQGHGLVFNLLKKDLNYLVNQ